MKNLLICCLSVLLIAAAPAPRGFVNDFANIIPDDREAAIETALQSYEKETTIEIAVETTDSLQGEEIEDYANTLFRQWGVGKQGADNGVLVVIAPNERKYRVEVGYGLEGDLTDADADIIARENLVSAFRANDYAGGVEHLTQALIKHLGTMAPEQREIIRRKMKEASEKRAELARAELGELVVTILGFVLIVGAVWLFVHEIRKLLERAEKRKRNAQRRAALRTRLSLVQPAVTQLMTERSALDLPNLPVWMQDDKEQHGGAFGSALETMVETRKRIELLIPTNIDEAEKLAETIDTSLGTAKQSLELLRTIPEQVRAFRDATERAVTGVCAEIDELVARAASLTKKQYRVADLVPALDLDRLQHEKESITALLANRGEGPQDASEVVNDKATRLHAKVRSLREALDSAVQTQSASQRRIGEIQRRVQMFPQLLAEHRERLARLRDSAPRNRWASFMERLPVFERTLGGVAPRLEVAERANGMDKQLFADAAATIATMSATLASIDASVAEAKTLESAIEQAKREYPNQLRSVQSALTAAKHLSADSDVGTGAKSRLAEAQRILDNIRMDTPPIDWIGACELVEQASAKVNQGSRLAQSDIDAAERERRRQRDEEARRRRLAEESSYSSSLSSYGSSSSDSSSNFSFGGGGSGGGGASGSW
jgi:uncharacterized membrane protein YgcG